MRGPAGRQCAVARHKIVLHAGIAAVHFAYSRKADDKPKKLF